MIAAFERATPGITVRPVFGASGNLARQIEQGADFDVFLSANLKLVDGLAHSGQVNPASVQAYAIGTLVLAVPTKSPVTKPADLTRAEIQHIAIANPVTAPYGTAGKQALERAGIWDAVESKIVTAGTVRQAYQYVESGNADAAFVGRASVAADSPLKILEVDRSLYEPIVQGLGIVALSKSQTESSAFVAFLMGHEGQAVLSTFGFLPPPEKTP